MIISTSVTPSQGIATLLQLFEGPLANVRFPDVDAASLLVLTERATASADTLTAARAALLEAQTALVAAESALLTAESELAAKAHRALGYARVYAAGDEELSRALAAVEISGPKLPPSQSSRRQIDLATEIAPAKRRGRPRKVPPELAADGERAGASASAPLFVLHPPATPRALDTVAGTAG